MQESFAALDDYSKKALTQNTRKVDAAVDGMKDAAHYACDPLKLHNDRPPTTMIEHERPEHILMCYMLAGGKSRQEIAIATGYSYVAVCNIVRQPWFRKRFLGLVREAGQDEVQAFIKAETLNSLDVLVQVRDNESAPPAVRIASAKELLDRALGKSVQHVKSETQISVKEAAAAGTEIEQELARVEEEMRARRIPHVN